MWYPRHPAVIVVLAFGILFLDLGESVAQTGFYRVRIENVAEPKSFIETGVFTTPIGASDPSPIMPGEAFEFEIDAAPGARLSFATMFAQSNDLFFAPAEDGIPLWDENGVQTSGDVTMYLDLWDVGTEINQEPGEGADQAPRQSAPDTGADENGVVRPVDDEFDYPSVADVISVTLTPITATRYLVRIENVSTTGTLTTSTGAMPPIPLSPGVWVVHANSSPLFTSGEPDRGDGLERIAEDGDPEELATSAASRAGLTHLLSPVGWAVHVGPAPIFEAGAADYGSGLERIAEDGNPLELAASFADHPVATGGATAVAVGAAGAGPIGPGGAFEFTIVAKQGSQLSFATMYAQSNDLFYAPDEGGIALWDDGGEPTAGDVTDQVMLWDAGTEVNERPGYGANQAPRQSAPDTGEEENGVVRLVDDGFTYPPVEEVIRVTITPLASTPFRVTIRNISEPSTLVTSTGEEAPIPLSPGVWLVHSNEAPLFTDGEFDRGSGLEAIAEDGNPAELAAVLDAKAGYHNGSFTTPVGSELPMPAGPGAMFEFMVDAAQGTSLSLATMFAQSNDIVYAADPAGIPLWDESGQPVSGDLTMWLDLWDVGTEVNQEPGVGADQAPRQAAPDTGDDENGVVRRVDDGFTYPADELVIELSIQPVATQSDPEPEYPRSLILDQNYPNPFNPETTISFALPGAGSITLRVYDILGREVAELVTDRLSAGRHTISWNGRDSAGREVASGTYLYRLEFAGSSIARTMVLLR